MISIIISSYQNHFFEGISQSISETIGCDYEIIKIKNPGLMGIGTAYNLGAAQAKYENLLFVHEDVIFLNKNWGKGLSDLLSDVDIGVVGIAGSDYIPNCPSGWYNAGKNNFLNIDQYDGEFNFISSHRTSSNEIAYLLDGVFLGMKKHWWNSLKFNEKIKGFHGYDIDLTARSARFKNNIVTNQVILRHYSVGRAEKNWFFTLLRIRKYYKRPSNQIVSLKLEIKNYYQYLYGLTQFKGRFGMLFYSLLYFNPRYLGISESFKILKAIIYKFLVRKKIHLN